MIKIAIMDDIEPDLKMMETLSRKCLAKKEISYEIVTYSRSDLLIADLKDQVYYDVFLLDMEMPGKTGMEVAAEIRKHYLEPAIVFVTRFIEHAPAAFEVNAFRYISKRMIREKLPEAFDALISRLDQLDERSYVLEKENGMERIFYRDIFYIRKDGKYVTIFHRNGENRKRTTLQDILKQLNAEEFFYVDKSYIVNVRHIMSGKRGELHMRDGKIIPVSRPRYNEVRGKIMNYWKERSKEMLRGEFCKK